jgi:3-oxoacyl-[acyl-carrier-protein] synthase II
MPASFWAASTARHDQRPEEEKAMTTVAVPAQPIVITSWDALSPYGVGRGPFLEGVARGGVAPAQPVAEAWDVPDERAHLVDRFDPVQLLGTRGTRGMDRVTALAVSTTRELLAGREWDATAGHDRTAFVLGTTNGSPQSMMQLTRSSMVEARPFYVDTVTLPTTVMNCAASRCAMWFGVTGPNATVATGRTSALTALESARRLLLSGRADQVLCGAAEEYSRARAWLERAAGTRPPDGPVPGEGCVLFELHTASTAPADAPVLAELLAVRFGVAALAAPAATDDPPDDVGAQALRRCVEQALHAGGVDPGQVWSVVTSGALGQAPEAALADLFGPAALERKDLSELIGDTAAASAGFALAALFERMAQDPQQRPRVAVVAAADPIGTVGCAVVRFPAGG